MKTLQVNTYARSYNGIFKRARFYSYFKIPHSYFAYDLRKENKIYIYKKLKTYCTILLNQRKNCFLNKVYFTFSRN